MKLRYRYALSELWYTFGWTVLLLAFFYNSYRYPFQINATSTSPTYSPTPFIFKVGKYLIFALMYAALGYARFYTQPRLKLGTYRQAAIIGVAFFLSFFPLLVGVIIRSIATIETGFFLCVAFMFHLYHRYQLPIEPLVRLLKWITLVAIGYNLMQILLFVTIGRLPALAYANSIAVRFGGPLDDPNGFGILIALLLGFSFYYFRGTVRSLVLGSLLLSLLLTQSLTALASVVLATGGAALSYAVLTYRASKSLLWTGLLGAGVVVGLILVFLDEVVAFVNLFLLLKAGSIEGHAESAEVLLESDITHWLGIRSMNAFSETGYINLIVNLGVGYTLLFIAYGIRAMYRCLRWLVSPQHDRSTKSLALAMLLYLLTVYIGMLNLPLEQVFPINVVTAFCLGLSNTSLHPMATPNRQSVLVARPYE